MTASEVLCFGGGWREGFLGGFGLVCLFVGFPWVCRVFLNGGP